MKRVLISFVLSFVMALPALAAQADNAIAVSSSSFASKFPTSLSFQLEAQSTAKINQVALTIQIGSCVTNRFTPTFTADTKVQATYQWNLGQNYLPPGVSGQFWWTIQDSAGNQMDTPKQAFRIDDPAHTWQKLSNDQLALYWYSGGQAFGQALFDRGLQAISFLQKDIGVNLDQQVQIFIYASHPDLMQSLAVGAQEWTGGEDFPEYSIVLIGIDPSELDWGLGATAHELTHQVVHRAIQNGCSSLGSLSLPPLMDEGLAVYNQDPGKPDPQFDFALKQAIQRNTLTPLRSLTSAFPADPNLANLAYGESWSFVDFLIRHYGQDKLGQWLKAVKGGGYYDDLFQQVYGLNLDGLEVEWRKDIGAQPRTIPTRNPATPSPIPTFNLSTGDVRNATPVPPPAGAPSLPADPIASGWGSVTGLIVLGFLGVVSWKRVKSRDL